MSVKTTDMTNQEAIGNIAITLADAICDGENINQQNYIRDLLIEFAEEIKRQAVEP